MSQTESPKFPARAPRIWHGMTLPVWLRLLAGNRFAVWPSRWPMAAAVTVFSLFNSLGRAIDLGIHGRRAAETEIEHPPLFIIGHWRTGTTLLHELLVLDESFNYPTTYQCMSPHHFLHTEYFIPRCFWFLLPRHRPMDNMRLGWNLPQEDEFALCVLGAPSPYRYWAFPARSPRIDEALDLQELSDDERERWKEAFLWFVRRLTLKDPRRLVFKSPTHTARVRTLLEIFPRAQFIHVVRNPFNVVPSTLRMWKRMAEVLGLQTRVRPDLESQLFDMYDRMYRRFEEDRAMLGPSQLCEVRYEDLVGEPAGQIERIYRELSLGDFSAVCSKIEEYWSAASGYRTNRYELPEGLRAAIAERWKGYIRRYGYDEGVEETRRAEEVQAGSRRAARPSES